MGAYIIREIPCSLTYVYIGIRKLYVPQLMSTSLFHIMSI